MKPFFAHLHLPENVDTLLFDMDGVLLDSLGLDIKIAEPLFSRHTGREVMLGADFIKSIFAYDPTKFIDFIFDHIEEQSGPIENRAALSPPLLHEYLALRRTTPFPLLPGIKAILETAAAKNFKRAVVSNNPVAEVKSILKTSGIDSYFSQVIGNDMSDNGAPLRKKPAPDSYLYAAKRLGAVPETCAVFEDSTLGARAGLAARMHVIGLLTGSATLDDMRALQPAPQQIFPDLMGPPQ